MNSITQILYKLKMNSIIQTKNEFNYTNIIQTKKFRSNNKYYINNNGGGKPKEILTDLTKLMHIQFQFNNENKQKLQKTNENKDCK